MSPRQFLSQREWETVRAFADVFIEGPNEPVTPDEVADNIDAHLARMKSKRVRSLKLILWTIEYVLPLGSLRPAFSRASREARRRMIEKNVTDPRGGQLQRDLAKIRTLFFAGYYGDARVQRTLPFQPVPHRSRFPVLPSPLPVPAPVIHPPGPDETTITSDICVIGSGAGGAIVAGLAAQAGKSVVLLEEGPYVPAAGMSHDESAMSALLYKEGGLQATVDLDMSILQGRCLGGTTVINNCICFRLDDPTLYNPHGRDLLAEWRALGANLDATELARSYDAVKARTGIAPLDPAVDGGNGAVFRKGWANLVAAGLGNPAMPSGTFAKNYNRCVGCGYCNFGCPYARKFSMLETYVLDASAAGARIITDAHAEKIEREGPRATGVSGTMADGRPFHVKAERIVVAAGAIGSSVLLLKSGITHNVGTRFSFNAATIVFGLYPTPVRAYDGVQMSSFVDAGDFLLETNFSPPMATSAILPGWFETHFDRMKRFDRLAAIGVQVGTRNNGRVKRTAFFRDTFGPVDYEMHPEDLATMRRGISLAAQVHFAAGAEAVLPVTFADMEMKAGEFAPGGQVNPAAIQQAIDSRIRRPSDLTLNSSHPQGGNPMGTRENGAVDASFRVHGYENLYVTDASVFPTTIRINPQWTIMALADYAWRLSIGA